MYFCINIEPPPYPSPRGREKDENPTPTIPKEGREKRGTAGDREKVPTRPFQRGGERNQNENQDGGR